MTKYSKIEADRLIAEGTRTRSCGFSASFIVFIVAILFLAIFLYFRSSFLSEVDVIEDDIVIRNDTFFLINPVGLCKSADKKAKQEKDATESEIKILILINSLPGNKERRQAIRDTWGSIAKHPQIPASLVFITGTSLMNQALTQQVQNESQLNKDIVQANLDEDKQNRTAKSAATLRWAAEYCANAEFVLKSEDDAFIDVGYLLNILSNDNKYENEIQFIGGYMLENKAGEDLEDDVGTYSEDDLSSIAYTYVMSHDAVQPLYSLIVNDGMSFPFTEVVLQNSGIQQLPDHRLWRHPPPKQWSSFKGSAISCGYNPFEMRSLWQELAEEAIFSFMMLDECKKINI